jgi:hypothetical protein
MKTFCILLHRASCRSRLVATEQEVVNQSASILRDFRGCQKRHSHLGDAALGHDYLVVKVSFGQRQRRARRCRCRTAEAEWVRVYWNWWCRLGCPNWREVTDFVFVLNSKPPSAHFRGRQRHARGDASAAAGPVGRDAHAAVTPTAAVYTYSAAKASSQGHSKEQSLQPKKQPTPVIMAGRYERSISWRDALPRRPRRVFFAPLLTTDRRKQSRSWESGDNLLYNEAVTSARSATCG